MKTVVVLAFAVGCGLIAMMGVQQMIAQQSNDGQDVPVKVLVATTDLPPGVLISDVNCEFKEYPASMVPEDAIRSKDEYHDRGLLVPVTAGDIIRGAKLGGRGEIAASASIPKGMRTFSIKVDDTKTHSGLLQPGDRVDLQVTYDLRTANGQMQTKTATLLEYIEVFASDSIRNLEAGESKEIKAKNITFLVTPAQAQLIQLAERKAEVIPVMRAKNDTSTITTEEEHAILLEELKTGNVYQSDEFARTKETKKENEPVNAAQAFKQFLSRQVVEKPKVEEPVEVVKAAEPQMWTIKIFAGEDVISQDVPLPVSLTTSGPSLGISNAASTTEQKTDLKPETATLSGETDVETPSELLESMTDRTADATSQGTMTMLKGLMNSFFTPAEGELNEFPASESETEDDGEVMEFGDEDDSLFPTRS
ncbi:Flp pilus assembly protein CpaB [Rubinisphaera margarita]|uniref:Flp pilus assembly protein CpaB n=1 Tax=Rubinisphaera margarita TaxID=2909586 RepID=UPI001EE8D108|nr:Flp pilus assembly protein CpaB [Rubinisphaera margarita]MCG6155859.1 Flp pilus assembly protein CpaB [Rubinisphaera margarita]